MSVPASTLSRAPRRGGSLSGRILVADDDVDSADVISHWLEREGCECHVVRDATQALAAVADGAFDVVVADINMEGNEALQLVRAIREQHAHLPIVLTTGYPSVETASAAVNLDVAAYLLKPLNLPTFTQTLREILQRQAVFAVLRQHRRSHEETLQRLKDMEDVFGRAPGYAAGDALHTYATLAFEQLSANVLDLRALLGVLLAKPGGGHQERLDRSRPLVLIAALQEAVQVLDRTKQSFKSKELAVLRQKLELLLRGAGAAPAPVTDEGVAANGHAAGAGR